MSDAPETEVVEAPKVVSLFTRAAYEAPVDPNEIVDKDVDVASEEAVSDFLDKVGKGELVGAVLMAWNPKRRGFDISVHLPPSSVPEEEALRYMGGLDLVKSGLQDIAEFGMEAMQEMNEEIDP